jgi:hypothetical protein
LLAVSIGLPGEARRELIMKREFSYEGVWVLIVCYACVFASMPRGLLTGLVAGAMGVDSGDHSALGYLREYVANGACAAGVLLIVCVFAAAVWKRYPLWTTMGVFGAWSLLTSQIIVAFKILWRCLNLTIPSQASALFEDHTLQTSTMWTGYLSGTAILLALSIARWPNSRSHVAGDRAQADSDQ